MTLKQIALELFNHNTIEDVEIVEDIVFFIHNHIEYNIRYDKKQEMYILRSPEAQLNAEFDTLEDAIDFCRI